MHQIKNYVTTQLIIPLACQAVASRMAAVDKKSVIKSTVFFGPSGTGKYTMAKAIAHHAGAFFLDMSPYNLKDVQSETKKLVERGQYTLKMCRD